MFKYLTASAAIAAVGLGSIAHASKPNISISCFGDSRSCKQDEITITNKSKNLTLDLYLSCPDKDNKKQLSQIGSFTLEPKESKCYSASEFDACYKSNGIFVKYNIELIVKSDDYPNWHKIKSCTWENR